MSKTTKRAPFYAARNDRDSERFGEELYGVREHDRMGWCALTAGIRTSMVMTKSEAEAAADRLNKVVSR